jgi:hypothetical protein
VKLELEGDSFVSGDRVRGTVTVERDGLQEISVGLLFREVSKGVEATARQVLAPGFDGAREYDGGATMQFELEVPGDAPPSIETRHGGLFWEVVAHTDRVGARTAGRRVQVTAAPPAGSA